MDKANFFDYFVIAAFLFSFLIAVGVFYISAARPISGNQWLRHFAEVIFHGPDRQAGLQHFSEIKDGFLNLTQNFGRVYLALFVTFIIGALLYLKIITAEAGLPILSGIAGFALGNNASNSSGPPTVRRE
jgi:hypothetical protein